MMIPVIELKQLENYYKGQITENALLNKAGRLAAEQHLILKDKSIPPSIAVNMTKPLASEQTKLVKRIRTGKGGPTVYQGTEESEGMADGPTENLLKQIIKGLDRPTQSSQNLHPRKDQGGTCHTIHVGCETFNQERNQIQTFHTHK